MYENFSKGGETQTKKRTGGMEREGGGVGGWWGLRNLEKILKYSNCRNVVVRLPPPPFFNFPPSSATSRSRQHYGLLLVHSPRGLCLLKLGQLVQFSLLDHPTGLFSLVLSNLNVRDQKTRISRKSRKGSKEQQRFYLYFQCIYLSIFSKSPSRYHYRWRASFLTFAMHSWPLSSEGSLACHT